MARSTDVALRRGRVEKYNPPFELMESKLHPPGARTATVPRTALIDRLIASPASVIAVIAPPGYGKTTLLAQWAEKSGRPVAWVSVDRGDNDPSVLLTYIATALDRVEPLDADMLQAIGTPRTENAAWVVPRLASALASMRQPVSLVLDHIEDLESQQALDAIAELLVGLNSGSQIAVASRISPAIPMARLRAGGLLEEVGVEDLAGCRCLQGDLRSDPPNRLA
jgi:LuxR family transcriptional regulator, maltose regulon positive regulatory protein